MATLIFRLNGVTEDEAEEVRLLLADNDLACYETHAGRWGIAVAGIWLREDDKADFARALLQEYAQKRQQRVREELLGAIHRGEAPTFWRRFREKPARVLAVAVLAAVILYLSIWPFLGFAD